MKVSLARQLAEDPRVTSAPGNFSALGMLFADARLDDVREVLPLRGLVKELERFITAEIVWCQEEPKNQGAWSFIEPNIEWVLTRIGAKHTRPKYIGRATSASPATGLASQHKAQQAALVDEALTVKG